MNAKQQRRRQRLIDNIAKYLADHGAGSLGTVLQEAMFKAWLITHPDQPEEAPK